VGKTVYYTATSADGFIADAGNSLDWLFPVEHTDPDGFASFFSEVGAMCMGATTYEWVLDHENLLAEPEKWRGYYGDTPAWVFTHRDLPAIPGVDIRFVSGDVVPVHAAMTEAAAMADAATGKKMTDGATGKKMADAATGKKMADAATGKNLWIVGGGELVGRFADAYLLDEIILGVTPVFLGGGAPLLPRRLLSDRVRLVDVKPDGQMAVLTYSVAREH